MTDFTYSSDFQRRLLQGDRSSEDYQNYQAAQNQKTTAASESLTGTSPTPISIGGVVSAKEKENLNRTSQGLTTIDRSQLSPAAQSVLAVTTDRDAALQRAATGDAVTSTRSRSQVVDESANGVERPENARPNPLNNYANYTYSLVLHAMSAEKFNSVVVDGNQFTTVDGTVLIASGGRRSNQLMRNVHFGDSDFFFDDVKLSTIIGHNARSRMSNVINLDLTISEPFGMTLIERLIDIANDLKIDNWDQMPFMLQIDFFGNSEEGALLNPIPEQTKYLPIKILEVKIRVGSQGSKYNISAVPCSHMALYQNAASTPVMFEVLSETIGDFFKSDAKLTTNILKDNRTATTPTQADVRRVDNRVASGGKPNAIQIYSYAAAMNAYQRELKEKGYQSTADEYIFEFDESIAKMKIVHNQKLNPTTSVPMSTKNNNYASSVDTTKELTRINAGTSIIDVVNLVLRNSEYYTNQILENGARQDPAPDQPIKSHKIIPIVRLGEWDKKRKVFQKLITYKIIPYSFYNTKYQDAKKSVPTKWAKEYNYIYTGKNNEVIDFEIDFNTMFYTAITANRDRGNEISVSIEDEQPETAEENQNLESGRSGTLQANRSIAVVNQTDVSTNLSGFKDKKVVEANDLNKSFMSSSRGDMITLKLKINGDPELIKQDDGFRVPSESESKLVFNTRTGSLNMDVSEIFAFVNFRVPRDIDDNTGLYKINDGGKNIFSGIYKIIQVDNIFSNGKFTQQLDCYRIFEQESDFRNGRPTTSARLSIDPSTITQQRSPVPYQADVRRIDNAVSTAFQNSQTVDSEKTRPNPLGTDTRRSETGTGSPLIILTDRWTPADKTSLPPKPSQRLQNIQQNVRARPLSAGDLDPGNG